MSGSDTVYSDISSNQGIGNVKEGKKTAVERGESGTVKQKNKAAMHAKRESLAETSSDRYNGRIQMSRVRCFLS